MPKYAKICEKHKKSLSNDHLSQDDSRCLHVTVHSPPHKVGMGKRIPLLSATFTFDDHIRCMAAKQRYVRVPSNIIIFSLKYVVCQEYVMYHMQHQFSLVWNSLKLRCVISLLSSWRVFIVRGCVFYTCTQCIENSYLGCCLTVIA